MRPAERARIEAAIKALRRVVVALDRLPVEMGKVEAIAQSVVYPGYALTVDVGIVAAEVAMDLERRLGLVREGHKDDASRGAVELPDGPDVDELLERGFESGYARGLAEGLRVGRAEERTTDAEPPF